MSSHEIKFNDPEKQAEYEAMLSQAIKVKPDDLEFTTEGPPRFEEYKKTLPSASITLNGTFDKGVGVVEVEGNLYLEVAIREDVEKLVLKMFHQHREKRMTRNCQCGFESGDEGQSYPEHLAEMVTDELGTNFFIMKAER